MYPPQDTVAGIIEAVQGELALPQSDSDATGMQLTKLVSSAGQELVLFYPWQQLNKTYEFTTTGVEQYDLPEDWAYFVDQTQWDKTNMWPLMGPSSPQQWSWLKSGMVAFSSHIRWRVRANKFNVFPSTTGDVINMEYISSWWVWSTDGLNGYRSVQNSDNVVSLDAFLLRKYLKLKFWETKGFNTQAFRDDFMRVYWNIIGKDKGAPVLSLVRRPVSQLITMNNIPEGNWNT
jgi:hypothetical protein